MSALNNIPSRIKYYLLDYKDQNMDNYLTQYPDKSLHDLTLDELKEYFRYASFTDLQLSF
jgi:hypothetical protein